MIYLFDACALIAFLNKESEGLLVKKLLEQAHEGKASIFMSIVNLCEVYYGYIQKYGSVEKADEIMQETAGLPVRLVDTINYDAYREAARIKGLYSIALGDAFLCGTAKSLGATIVTKDSEIRKPEVPETLSVLWINQ